MINLMPPVTTKMMARFALVNTQDKESSKHKMKSNFFIHDKLVLGRSLSNTGEVFRSKQMDRLMVEKEYAKAKISSDSPKNLQDKAQAILQMKEAFKRDFEIVDLKNEKQEKTQNGRVGILNMNAIDRIVEESEKSSLDLKSSGSKAVSMTEMSCSLESSENDIRIDVKACKPVEKMKSVEINLVTEKNISTNPTTLGTKETLASRNNLEQSNSFKMSKEQKKGFDHEEYLAVSRRGTIRESL